MKFILPLFALSLFLTACATTSDADIRRNIVGTWSHNVPWNDGKERTLILKGSQDTEGKAYFEFVQQPFSYKPIFTGFNVRQGRVEISFKMVLYSDESDVSPHTLRYVLRERNGIWSGQFFQSWEKSPVDVRLKKQS
jgi:hypothetical protein